MEIEKLEPHAPESIPESLEQFPVLKVQELIHSEQFIETLQQWPESEREKLLGIAVEYFCVFKDGYGFAEFWNQMSRYPYKDLQPGVWDPESYQKDKFRMWTLIAAQKLGIPTKHLNRKNRAQHREDLDAIFSFIRNNYIENGYVFHSFNGTFESGIQQNGLIPIHENWSWEEMEGVLGVFEELGVPGGVRGWKSSEGKVYFSDNLDHLAHFAYSSPEWFCLFVQGSHMRPCPPFDIDAYFRKDKAASRKNVEILCDQFMDGTHEDCSSDERLTTAQKEQVLQYFDRIWDDVVTDKSAPKVAVIERSAVGADDLEIFNWQSYTDSLEGKESRDPKYLPAVADQLYWTCSNSRYQNSDTTSAVPPEAIQILDLPAYETIFPDGKYPPKPVVDDEDY